MRMRRHWLIREQQISTWPSSISLKRNNMGVETKQVEEEDLKADRNHSRLISLEEKSVSLATSRGYWCIQSTPDASFIILPRTPATGASRRS